MLDIKFIRENPDIVKENIKKKFQDEKLPLVDEVIELDSQRQANIQEADQLRSDRNRLSKQVGMLMGQAKKDPSKLAEAEAVKKHGTVFFGKHLRFWSESHFPDPGLRCCQRILRMGME